MVAPAFGGDPLMGFATVLGEAIAARYYGV
jgi:hypothetical protein